MVILLHTFEMSGFLTDFQNFSRVFRPTDNLFRVMVDIITRVFNDSGATRADLIYQWSRIKNRLKHLWWSFFTKIVNDFSLCPANIHLLRLFHWQFLITYTFSVSLKFRACLHHRSVRRIHSKECYILFTYAFLAFFCCFHEDICVFIIFISFFDEVSNLCNRILTNQKPE